MIELAHSLQATGPAHPWILLGFVALYAVLAGLLTWVATSDSDGSRRSRRCPHCGRPHDPSYRYCGHCAARVEGHR